MAFDWNSAFDRAFGVLDTQLEQKGRERVARINAEADNIRAASARESAARQDQTAADTARRRDASYQFGLATDRQDRQRDDNRRLFESQTDRRAQDASDGRALLETRAGVYQDAFESRRGDTLVNRVLWPLAAAVGVASGIWLLAGGSKR